MRGAACYVSSTLPASEEQRRARFTLREEAKKGETRQLLFDRKATKDASSPSSANRARSAVVVEESRGERIRGGHATNENEATATSEFRSPKKRKGQCESEEPRDGARCRFYSLPQQARKNVRQPQKHDARKLGAYLAIVEEDEGRLLLLAELARSRI